MDLSSSGMDAVIFQSQGTSRNQISWRSPAQKWVQQGDTPHIGGTKKDRTEGARHTWALCTALFLVLSERIGGAYKPLRTIRNVISKLKDPIPTGDKFGVVYHSSCKDCDQFYIGETGMNLKQ